jgi:hypothetical protein
MYSVDSIQTRTSTEVSQVKALSSCTLESYAELGDKAIRPVASFVLAILFTNPYFLIHGFH